MGRSGRESPHLHWRTFLCSLEQGAVFFGALVDVDDFRAGEQLHDETRGDDGRDAQLHQGAAIRRQNHAHPERKERNWMRAKSKGGWRRKRRKKRDENEPVKGIGRLARANAVERHLRADEENEQRNDGPHGLLFERHATVSGRLHLGQHHHQWLDQMQNTHHLGWTQTRARGNREQERSQG